MAPQTRSALEFLAAQYGCVHGGEPWIGGLMAKIARGELLVVPAPPALPDGVLAPRQPSSDEDRAWLESDLSGLGRYEPYDWGDVDPLSLGSAVVEGQVEGHP
ncbi:hypothetical protein [Gloeobacter morelensis]|uniref:Uncharacterized protein n=1 Tax=Gloeobacter morelensis MG652769 TaxID=2781736 RepID=A0ABY3PLZ3_9CYAN|nr:hypothetical protein [Gloeobacter morelensis]UFP94677.1 hypothetical protein ISF26_23620 [Gloeobacter morelensis MG652769]